MSCKPVDGAKLLRKFKMALMDALRGDPDFVLQHCHASQLLSEREYECISRTPVPSAQARDILDYIMRKDNAQVQRFLELLKSSDIQETFPKLGFLKDLPVRSADVPEKKKRKRKKEMKMEEFRPKRLCKPGARLVTEKQLMMVTRHIGGNWKELARVVLDIPTIKLDQIVEENPRSHREQVFEMLRCWSMRERQNATASHLYLLLTQEDSAVQHGSIDFLLED